MAEDKIGFQDIDLPTFRQLIINSFSLLELSALCLDMDVEYDNLPGSTRDSKAAELIQYFQRRNQLDDLIEYCKKERPNVNWLGELQKIKSFSPYNVPQADNTRFVMRKKAFDQVVETLKTQLPGVAIIGLGGVGKSSLAREIAYRCAIGQPPFPKYDVVVWVSARDREDATTLNHVLNETAHHLDYPGWTQSELEDKAKKILRLLNPTFRLLTVVDNYESISDQKLHEWLMQMPWPSKVLITSRGMDPGSTSRSRNLRPEQNLLRIELRGMEDDEARAFIKDREQFVALEPPLTDEEISDLINITMGNPKAIELAVGYMKYNGLATGSLVENLYDQRGELFDYLFTDTWPALSDTARQLLMIIFMFPGGAPLSAMRAISGTYDLKEPLSQLINRALVDSVAREVYTLHSLVAKFVSSKLKDDPALESALRNAWLEWIGAFVEEVEWPWQDLQKLDRLAPEEATAYAAIKWAWDHQQFKTVIRLARGVDHYYYVRGFWEKKAEVDKLRIAAARAQEDVEEEALSLAQYVQMLCTRGNPDDLEEVGNQHLSRLGDLASHSLSLSFKENTVVSMAHAKAFYHIALKEYERAHAILSTTQEVADKADLKYRIANRHWCARCLLKLGELQQAEEMFNEALHEAKQSNHERSEVFCQRNLAEIALARGDLEAAARLLKNVEDLSLKIKDRRYEAMAHLAYAQYFLAKKQYPEARVRLAQAQDLYARLSFHADDRVLNKLKETLDDNESTE